MQRGLFDLGTKKALVTGASRGIGLAIAQGLAAFGADVAIVARSADQLSSAGDRIARSTRSRVWAFPFDLTDLGGITDLFDQAVQRTGGIDILVNAAGTTIRTPTQDLTGQDLSAVMGLNLAAPLLLSQALCRHCRGSGKPGRIINIASLLYHAARPTIAAYTCSKTALVGLTKTCAVEWAQFGINVNAIAPGYIMTDLTAALQADPQFDRWVVTNTPLNRWGMPEDLVGMAVLLASRAGDFITGQVLFVDGGWSAML